MSALPAAASIRAEPFFLPAAAGQRFGLFYPPAGVCRGAVLYVHPFGEEMNKARRMAALQARALAAQGYGVLALDLHGCGDSSGDFGEARWDSWKQDLALGQQWLQQRLSQPVSLFGLRLGALLALDYARAPQSAIAQLVLWQPVQSGATFLTQFLRLRIANDMLAEGNEKSGGTQALREQLRAGQVLEIAGYDLAPELAAAIEALDAAALTVTGCPVHWLEAVSADGRPLSPAGAKVTAAWQKAGVDLQVHLVTCPPFWATQEIAECPALVAATSAIFAHEHAGVSAEMST
ncbi:MAG: hydrolase 2, exosortase A system-associated [Massilia sp.]